MFKPCPVPPGFMFHDNLIRRISIFGQSYELKLGFVIQLALMSKFKESLIIVIIKQLKTIQYGGAKISNRFFHVWSKHTSLHLLFALNAYQNRFLTCLQSPQNLGIQFSIFIQ